LLIRPAETKHTMPDIFRKADLSRDTERYMIQRKSEVAQPVRITTSWRCRGSRCGLRVKK
jgi:hypothetical protein